MLPKTSHSTEIFGRTSVLVRPRRPKLRLRPNIPDIYISQGSVATRLRCGRIFNESFITRLLLSLTVKEL